jgi:hypothetical protein
LLRYLYDHLDKDQLEIDTINFSGPRFADVDNRLMSLQLVKNGMTDAVMFDPQGRNILPQQYYIKEYSCSKRQFSSVTKVNMDMYEKSLKMFLDENKVEKENTLVVLKLPYQTYAPMVKLTNVISWTENCLCSLGQT